MKRYQDCGILEKTCRCRWYLPLPFKWFWFSTVKSMKIIEATLHEDGVYEVIRGKGGWSPKGNSLWCILKSMAQTKMGRHQNSK